MCLLSKSPILWAIPVAAKVEPHALSIANVSKLQGTSVQLKDHQRLRKESSSSGRAAVTSVQVSPIVGVNAIT